MRTFLSFLSMHGATTINVIRAHFGISSMIIAQYDGFAMIDDDYRVIITMRGRIHLASLNFTYWRSLASVAPYGFIREESPWEESGYQRIPRSMERVRGWKAGNPAPDTITPEDWILLGFK